MWFQIPITAPLLFLLYVLGVATVIAACVWRMRRADPSGALPALPVPAAPNPYEIAYLRGGPNELSRLVIFRLVQRGYLRVVPVTAGGPAGAQWLLERSGAPDGAVTKAERRAWEWFDRRKSPREIFASRLPAEIEAACPLLRETVEREQFLRPRLGEAASNVLGGGSACIVALTALWVGEECSATGMAVVPTTCGASSCSP